MTEEKRHFLDYVFNPRSVAVVGATDKKESVNYYLVSNLVGLKYTGKIYPVHPRLKELLGLKVYPSVSSIEDEVDLVVISVGAGKTLDVVRDCVAKRVKAISITAGGFSEGGAEGKNIEREMLRLTGEAGIRVVGPNALSPINTANNLAVGFGPMKILARGNLGFIFQSGLYQTRINWLYSHFKLRMSKLIDLGNKMDIKEVDALEYLAQDDETKAIGIHMESIAGDARRFLKLLKQTTAQKPVVVLKSGRTEAGAKAASSHTGAIIKSGDIAFDTALKQGGAIRARDLEEFFDFTKVFNYLPPLKGNRLAISVFSGGEGVLAIDACQGAGLVPAELSPSVQHSLRKIFPPWESSYNPFDFNVSMQFHSFVESADGLYTALLDDPNVDCLVVQAWGFSPHEHEHAVKALTAFNKYKPVAAWIADPLSGKELGENLEAAGVPVFSSGERAVRALGALHKYYQIKNGR
ncbi:MAG: CoA-binding protein [Dehalococcoidales bacterium]|nr:CoA-binding protein [Dehalococcoidales bacterium]